MFPQRESWMEAPMDFIPTISRQEIKERQNKGEKEKQERNILDQVRFKIINL
jgi:hypothetical protein